MKNKLSLLLLLLALTVSIFASCAPNKEESNGADAPTYNTGNLIFEKGTQVYIMMDNSIETSTATKVANAVLGVTGVYPKIMNTDEGNSNYAPAGTYEHEIVLGRPSAQIVRDAYAAMNNYLSYAEDEIEKDQKLAGYSVYSDGSSIVLAYTDDIYGVALSDATDYLVEEYFGADSVKLEKGYSDTVAFSLYDRLGEIDQAYLDKAWAKLGEFLDDEVVAALKELSALYTDDAVTWLANLYESYVCTCGTEECQGGEMCGGGGFYYANTGRDNVGFLPDIDSTYQALVLVGHMGMQTDVGYGKGTTPEWMQQQIVQFVKMRQDPNGFFYHPQWTKEQVDAKTSRKGRDFDRAIYLLNWFGGTVTYTVTHGKTTYIGDGLKWDGTPIDGVSPSGYITAPLSGSNISAVSKVIATTTSDSVVDHLKTKSALTAYLTTMGERIDNGEAYSVNNELANQTNQFIARDVQLEKEKADWRVSDMVIKFLNDKQNSNGTWSVNRNYNAVDALFKAAHVYTALNQPFPHAKQAAIFAVETINSTQITSHICNIYNCWSTIYMLVNNIKKFGDKADAQEVQDALMSVAADGIRATLRKYIEYKKADGSFSYYKEKCNAESQGMQLCLSTNEGDMNATSLTYSVWSTIFSCFNLTAYEIPLHTSADYARYIDILEKNSGVIKNDPIPAEPVDFEDDLVGSAPTEVTYDLQSNGATLFVVEDKREGASGNVLELSSMPGKGDVVYVPCKNISLGTCFVFEGDFCVEDAKNSYIAQINVGASCYMLNLMLTDAKDENGNSYKKVKILECSSQGSPRIENDLGISARLGEWFNIRIEYYLGSHDSVRIKVYFNGELAAVTDNYYDHKGTKITTGTGNPNKYYSYTQINVMSDQQAVLLMDNLYTDKTDDSYTPAHDLDNQPLINIDPPDRNEVIYDFEDQAAGKNYPEDFTVSENEGALEIIDGESNNVLHISQSKGKGASLYLPAVTRTRATNCAVVEMDVTVASGAVGSSLNLKLNANNLISGDTGAITAFNIEIIEIDGKSYAVLTEAPGGVSINTISACAVELGSTMRLRLEYYEDTKVTLVYVYDNADKLVLCASSDTLASGGGVRKFQRLTLSVSNDSVIDLTLDNIKAERIVKSFEEATVPDKEKIIYDFDKVTEGITYPESALVTNGTDKLISLGTSNQSIKVPVNYRAVISNFVSFSANVSHSASGANATYRVSYCDKDGNIILAYDLLYKGGRLFVYEHTEYGTSEQYIASFAANDEAPLTIEYFDRNDITNIYYDDSCIAVSSVVYSKNTESLICEYVTVTALTSLGSLNLDDVVAESYNKVCKNEKITGSNAEDDAEKITFESSSTGSIPAVITTGFSSIGADLRIEQMLDKLDKATKVLAFDSTSDAGDYMYVGATNEDESYNAIIFEADLAFNKADGKALSYQLFFEDMKGSSASRLYLTSIEYSSSTKSFTIKDYSGGSSSTTVQVDGQNAKLYRNDGTAIKYTPEGDFSDWFTLRIEIYEGSRNEMRIKTYINDTLIYITNNFYNSHAKDEHAGLDLVKKVSILALSDCEATMYLDNASLVKTTKELEPDAEGVTTKLFPTVNTPVIIIPPAPVDPNEKIPEVMDFEDEKIYSNTTVEDKNGSNWPTLEVIDGKLNFVSDGGDYIYIKPTVTKGSYTYAVFEADLSFEFNVSETASQTFYTFTVCADGGSSFPTAYRFNIEYNAATGVIKFVPLNSEKAYGTVISKAVGTPGSPTTETTPIKLTIEQYFVNDDVVIVISIDGDVASIVNSAENQSYKNTSGIDVSNNMFYTYKSDGTGKPYLTMGRIAVNSHRGTNTVMKLDNVTFVQKNKDLDKTLIEPKPGSLVKGEAGLGVYHNSIGGYLYNITNIWKEVDLNNANATGERFIWKSQGGTNDAKAIDADGKSDAGVNDPTKAYSYIEIASYGTNKALAYGQVYSHTRASRLYLKNNEATTGSLYVFETDLVIGSMEGVKAGDAVLSFHLRNNKTETSDFFGNLRIYKNESGTYSLGYNEYKTYADIESAVWTNIRLEYYHEAGVARYYVNGELVGSERIVTSLDTSSYEFVSVSLIGSAYDAFVWLDNTVITATDDEYVRTDGDPDELATVLPVKGGANGIVALIHDDGDLDTMSILDSVYGKYSLRADVAMIANRVYDTAAMAPKSSVDSWKAYVDTNRWGLINHSFSHTFWGEATDTALNVDEEKMLLEIVSSGDYLREAFTTERVLTFAFPGFSSVVDTLGHGKAKTYAAAMALIKQNYIAAREYNFPTSNHIGLNLYDLNYAFMGASSISLGEANLAKVLERIDGAAAGRLTVLFSHRVVENASEITEGDTSTVPRSYIEAIAKSVSDYAAEGYVWNAHYEDAMLYLKEAESARVSAVQDGDTITVTLTDSLPDEIYNYALTVEIVVPDSWEGVKITQGDKASYARAFERDGKWIVYADIVPDGGVATVVAESDTTLLPEAPTLPCKHADKEPVDSVCDVCGREYYDPDTCTHKDTDGDGECDNCKTEFTCEHIDADGNDKCDKCEAPYSCPHYDEDINRVCDVCGDEYYDPETCEHKDADGDKKCNLCSSEFVCEHKDASGDDKCDNCDAPYSCPHYDSKTEPDRICDVCGDVYYDPETCEHKDADGDGTCDNCETKFTCEHADEDKDGYCDSCTAPYTCPHRDRDPIDSICDKCGEVYYDPATCDHTDEDGDEECDKCGLSTKPGGSIGGVFDDGTAWT